MAKRFTDTEKWDKPWYRKLPSKYKLLWHYVTDKCTQIGLWHVDLETAGYYTGEVYDPDEAKTMLGKQIQEVASGAKWFIKDFIPFQYGTLNPANHFHRSIIKTLNENGVSNLGCPTPQGWGVPHPQERKGKDKDDVEVKRGSRGERFVPPLAQEVTDYAKSIEFILDGQSFVDYYEARGWQFKNGQPMKRWKAAVRYWKSSGGSYATATQRQGQHSGPQAAPGKYDHLANK